MKLRLVIACLFVLFASTSEVLAWGPEGHQLVGSIADHMLNPHASKEVKQLLGFTLRVAGPWADCVKSVKQQPDGTYKYISEPQYSAPCKSFETPAEEARMADYAARNWNQPLHVGAVYLDAQGHEIDPPGAKPVDESTETEGGNFIFDGGKKLHWEWDAIPPGLSTKANADMINRAKAVPKTKATVEDVAVIWASDTVMEAQEAFKGMTFVKTGPRHWNATLSPDHDEYWKTQNDLKRQQLAKGGARLAELLNAIWP